MVNCCIVAWVAGNDLVVIVVVVVVIAVVSATTPFLAGRFVLFPRCGKLTPSPALAMGYCLRAVVGATTQLNTGRRNMKLPEGDISMELAADMKNIFFSVLAVYSGIGGTLIVKILCIVNW